jgi:hypothetical protein
LLRALGETLISRLNKISLNPFGEWSYSKGQATGIDALPDSIRGVGDMPELSIQQPMDPYGGTNGYSSSNTTNHGNYRRRNANNSKPPVLTPQVPSPNTTNGANKRRAIELERGELRQYLMTKPKTLSLFTYYFTELANEELPRYSTNEFPQNLKVGTGHGKSWSLGIQCQYLSMY